MFESKMDFKILSEIARDVAQVFFATAVVSQLVAGIDKENWLVVILGLVTSIAFWWIALRYLGREVGYD